MFAWTLICHLHLLPSLAGSHHHNSLNQLGWNIVGPFPRTKGWFSHRVEPIWQLAALPPSLRLQLTSTRGETPRHCHGDPGSPEALQRHSPGSSQTAKEPYQQKRFCQRSRNKLRVGIAGEQEQDYWLHWFSRPEGHWAGGIHLLHTAELQSLPATTARPLQAPACSTSVNKPCPKM